MLQSAIRRITNYFFLGLVLAFLAASNLSAQTTSPAASNSAPLAPTLVKFSSGYHLYQGIPFDLPVVFQFPLKKKVNIRQIMYLPLGRNMFKKYSSPDNSKFDVKGFFSEAFNATPSYLKLTSLDTVAKSTDPTAAPYQLTTSYPAYFESNRQYLFLIVHPFYDETDLYNGLNKIILPFIQVFANHVANGQYNNDGIGRQMNALKDANPLNGNNLSAAVYNELGAIPDEKKAVDSFGSRYIRFRAALYEKSGYTGIPDGKMIIPSNAPVDRKAIVRSYECYQVAYKTAIDMQTCKDLIRIHPILRLPDFSQLDCLKRMLASLAGCAKCTGSCGICGYLSDTTGFLNFLSNIANGANDQVKLGDYVAKLNGYFHDDEFILNDDTLKISDNLKKYAAYFTKLRDLAIYQQSVDCRDQCDDVLNAAKSALTCLSALNDQYNWILAFRNKYKSYLDDYSFSSVIFFGGDSYIYSMSTRTNIRITSDVGVVNYGIINGTWNASRIVPYFGIQVNFKYIQHDIPFSDQKNSGPLSLKRFSAFLGITTFSIKEAGKIDNLFGSNTALVGLGYKITPAFRCVAGAMGMKIINPNPIVTSVRFGSLFFAGFSFDSNAVLTSIVNMVK
jgi:hypothetical protein